MTSIQGKTVCFALMKPGMDGAEPTAVDAAEAIKASASDKQLENDIIRSILDRLDAGRDSGVVTLQTKEDLLPLYWLVRKKTRIFIELATDETGEQLETYLVGDNARLLFGVNLATLNETSCWDAGPMMTGVENGYFSW